jgi:hypothetical protein
MQHSAVQLEFFFTYSVGVFLWEYDMLYFLQRLNIVCTTIPQFDQMNKILLMVYVHMESVEYYSKSDFLRVDLLNGRHHEIFFSTVIVP